MIKPLSFYFIKKLDNICFDICLMLNIPFYKYIHFKKILYRSMVYPIAIYVSFVILYLIVVEPIKESFYNSKYNNRCS